MTFTSSPDPPGPSFSPSNSDPAPSSFTPGVPAPSDASTSSNSAGSSTFPNGNSASTSMPSSTLSLATSSLSSSASIFVFPTSAVGQNISGAILRPVCVGQGLDAGAEGLLATLVVPSVIGLVLWIFFAVVRPRFRQVYGLREWFVQQDLRPRALGSGFLAFLFPHVPLVPSLSSDFSSAGRSAATDAELFPSDEQLNQRALYICLVIVFGWTLLGLAGALPLYLIATPCLATIGISTEGFYTTLHDLSLLRLLRIIDDSSNSHDTTLLHTRGEPGFGTDEHNGRVRVIVLTAMTLLLAVLPALVKIIRELNRAIAFRKTWVDVKCEGRELGWLSARRAPGFSGWGEKRLKDFIAKNGLSSGFESSEGRRDGRNRHRDRRGRRPEEQPLSSGDTPQLEVDIQSVFSISDTHRLAVLIEERDEILENLEIAETRYIGSFRVTTPDPSITEFKPNIPQDPTKPYISRPLPLGNGARQRRRRRTSNPAFAASSFAPVSFVAPSSYYKLRGIRGVSGGRIDSGIEMQPDVTDSVYGRSPGGRYLEMDTSSDAYRRFASPLRADTSGEPSSARDSVIIPDPRHYGPNFTPSTLYDVDEHGMLRERNGQDEEWVDLTRENGGRFETDYNGIPPEARRRPKKGQMSSEHRETFPLRNGGPMDLAALPPPHLRLQPSQPFVRPVEGINYENLGDIYTDITEWRSKLKAINLDIADAQRDCYTEIAEGHNVKGWLMIGRGLGYIPGMQLIEGRAKEDVRWDVLQNEPTILDWMAVWAVIFFVAVLLVAGLTAASGLAIATAPGADISFPFLKPLLETSKLASGIATVLTPAVAATLFVVVAFLLVNGVLTVHGSSSISAGQLFTFKVIFYLFTFASGLWIVAVGAILFGLQSLIEGESRVETIANGSVYMGLLAMAIIINIAIIFPALIVLQPFRLWRVAKAERSAVTPRQRFRALYPRVYNPALAIGPCVLAIVFASTFSLIFPLIGLPVTVLLLLTLIAHRYLVGYVYVRTHSQTGGLVYIWLLKRLGSLLSLQPILLGLIFLSRHLWIEGGILIGSGVLVILFVESFVALRSRRRSRSSLASDTRTSLQVFAKRSKDYNPGYDDDDTLSSGQETRIRGSMASVLEMMSLTLAVMPSSTQLRGPLPLQTETLDDLTATERAARTHPDAPPHLPPLPFADHAEEMAGILYAPELIAPPPIIWLPQDSAGVARSEAVDLQKYHDLQVTLDVRAKEDVMPRQSHESRGRRSAERRRAS
ncbi:hypothetical protein BDN72DRAFT_46203 [Pluteus cervinus]|uniref:Uncharacterized protein n=1 Tax=Pluteus cervinus TaxID=181527 RepID=A0ACD3BHH9_9AGAR|nr:hypothetical protein BDN72DRAFT_46203 [Pluteus cervinus]